jgi:hypothetical protein
MRFGESQRDARRAAKVVEAPPRSTTASRYPALGAYEGVRAALSPPTSPPTRRPTSATSTQSLLVTAPASIVGSPLVPKKEDASAWTQQARAPRRSVVLGSATDANDTESPLKNQPRPPPDPTLLALHLRGITPTLNALSCSQQLDWEARRSAPSPAAATLVKSTGVGGCKSSRGGEPDYEHYIPERVLRARVSTAESRLAAKLRDVLETDAKQARALELREAQTRGEHDVRRQMEWLKTVALVVPVTQFMETIRYRRAYRVIRTIFVGHVILHFRRRARNFRYGDWLRAHLALMPPVSLDLIATCVPQAALAIRSLTAGKAEHLLFGGPPPLPLEYAGVDLKTPTPADRANAERLKLCKFQPVCYKRGDYAFWSRSRAAVSSAHGASDEKTTADEPAPAASRQRHDHTAPVAATTLSRLAETTVLLIQSGQLHITYRVVDKDASVKRYRETHGPGSAVSLDALLGQHGRPHVAVCDTDLCGFVINGVDLNLLLHRVDEALRPSAGAVATSPPRGAQMSPQQPQRENHSSSSVDDANAAEETNRKRPLHKGISDIVLARRLYALGAVPLSAAYLRASSPFLALWSDRGLAKLSSLMVAVAVAKGAVLPTDDTALATLVCAQTASLETYYRTESLHRRRLTWCAPTTKHTRRAHGPPAQASSKSCVAPRQANGVIYVVVHGTLTRLASAGEQGHTRATANTATATSGGGSLGQSSPTIGSGLAAGAAAGTHVKSGVACGVVEAVLEKPFPAFAATTHVDAWALREVDLAEVLAHEDASALIPAFTALNP